MDEKAINEAFEYNRLFDERIKSTRTVSEDDLAKFDDAYQDDSASSINWLLSKLKLICKMIKQGEYIYIYEESKIEVYTIEGVISWIKRRYPYLSEEVKNFR